MNATLSTAARRTAGVTTLTLLLAGPPYALLRYLDSPLPDRPPTWQTLAATLTSPLTDEMIGSILTALLWAAWASFAWSVLAELATALTGLRLPQPRALTPARGIAALLVAMITGGVLATAAQAATPPPPALAHPSASGAAAVTVAVAQHGPLAATADAPAKLASATPAHAPTNGTVTLVADGREYTHTVKRGDTLSKIAEQWLGDPNRWPEIFALNRGTHFPTVGGTLRNPNLIYPGWTLDLPADATPPAAHQPRPAAPTPPAPPPASAPTPTPTDDAPTKDDATASTPRASASAPVTTTPDSGAVTASAPTTSTADAASPTGSASSQAPRAHRGVWLPSGSWVDLGLALAIAAAVALVWAHRQRRYRPRKPSARPHLDDADLTPMPGVVRQIRRSLRRAAAGRPDPHDPARLRPAHPDTAHAAIGDEHPPPQTAGSEHGDALDDQDHDYDETVEVGDAAEGGLVPVAPALDNPLSTLWPPAGLGLTGPGAEAAARGFLTAALACGGVEHPEARTEVVIPSMTAATLLGVAAVTLPRTPRLTVTAGLDEALELLETLALERTRLVYQHEVDTVAELRRADPYEEPLPPVMLLADVTSSHERARVAAVLAQGQRLDIHGVLLGDWPDGDTVTIAADGATTPADGDRARHGAHPADIGRLTVLDPTETVDLMATLAESHTGLPQAPAPAEPTPTATTEGLDDTADTPPASVTTGQNATNTTADGENRTGDAQDANAVPAQRDTDVAAPTPASRPDRPDETASDSDDTPTSAADDSADEEQAPVRVRVLGTPGVVDGDPQRTPRAKSLELLVYLAVHDGVASTEAILDDLLPDAPSSKAAARLYTYVSGLRAVLRHAAGCGGHVPHPDHRYLLNRDLLDVDLWRMRAAIRDAARASDPTVRAAALRRAVDAYTGPLAQDCDYEWVESYREAVRQEALDASLALADTLTGKPAEQLAVLDAAIAHSPYHEALYQAAMRARADLGDADGIRTLRRTLTRRLTEIDAEPTDDTLTLADQLVTDLRRRGHAPDTRRPTDADGATG